MLMRIIAGDFNNPQVRALLEHHVVSARAETAPGSAHALDLESMKASDVNFWAAWDGDVLLGVGALKRLSNDHGEIKSMHTVEASRRKGVGTTMLLHIVEAARATGLSRLSLETGSWPYFFPARELYKRHGFVECPPFDKYVSDPNSVFMSLDLRKEGQGK
jgi:putative acetyltransferase